MWASSPQYAHAFQWTALSGNREWSGPAMSEAFCAEQNAPDTASNCRSDERLCETVGASIAIRIASNPRMLPNFLRNGPDMNLTESRTSRRVVRDYFMPTGRS